MKTGKKFWGIGLFFAALLVIVALLFAASAGSDRNEGQTAANDAQEEKEPANESSSEEGQTAAEDMPDEKTETVVNQEDVMTEENETLTFMVEGEEEKVPAERYVGDGFSILIPKEGFTMHAPDGWLSEDNDKVQLWVARYAGKTLLQVTEEITADGYAAVEDGTLFQKKRADGVQQFQTLTADDTDVWGVFYTYPDNSETTEGFGSRLPVIAASFCTLKEDASSDGKISGDAQEVEELLEAFSEAYFKGDAQGIRQYLTTPYQWDIEVRNSTGEVPHVKVRVLDEVQNAKVGDTCLASVEFLDSPQSDSFWYLSVELVKQKDGWRISFYGLEG